MFSFVCERCGQTLHYAKHSQKLRAWLGGRLRSSNYTVAFLRMSSISYVLNANSVRYADAYISYTDFRTMPAASNVELLADAVTSSRCVLWIVSRIINTNWHRWRRIGSGLPAGTGVPASPYCVGLSKHSELIALPGLLKWSVKRWFNSCRFSDLVGQISTFDDGKCRQWKVVDFR